MTVAAMLTITEMLMRMQRSGRAVSLAVWDTDPTQWVCCWGEHRWDEVQGFGYTPDDAVNVAWLQGIERGLEHPA